MNIKASAYSLIIEGRKMDGENSRLFSIRSEHATLKDAVKTLRRLGDSVFDEAIVKERNLPQHIQNAMIQDTRDHQIILTKYPFRGSDFFHAPPGVLVRLNGIKISLEDFKQRSGLDLERFPKLGDHPDYFQVASREQLQNANTPLKKFVHHASKLMRSFKAKGPTR